MKKTMLCAILVLLCGCSSNTTKEATGSYTGKKGETTTAKVKWEKDAIKEVEFDETTGDTTKKKLGAEYNMKQASGIGKEWNEQVMFLEKYIEQNGMENLQMNAEGKSENPDVMAGCTISLEPFVKAIDDAKTKTE